MKGILLIFGNQFPVLVVEQAFDWAKEFEAELHVIFLVDPTAQNDDEAMAFHQRTLEKRASACHFGISVDVLNMHDLEKVMIICQSGDQVFLDPYDQQQVHFLKNALLENGFIKSSAH